MGVQVHVVVLQSIDPIHYMRTACIYSGIRFLISDIVMNVSLVIQEVAQIRRRLFQHQPLLHVDPLKLLIWLYAISVEVLEHSIVCSATQCPLFYDSS